MTTPPIFGTPVVRDAQGSSNGGGNGGNGGFWEEVANAELVAGATSVDITGLDGDTDQVYRFIIAFRENGTGGANLLIRFNGDSGVSYDYQELRADGATVTGSRVNGDTGIKLAFGNSGDTRISEGVAYVATTGQQRAVVCHAAREIAGNAPELSLNAGNWRNTADNVTQITFVLGAGQFAAGGRVIVLKPTAPS